MCFAMPTELQAREYVRVPIRVAPTVVRLPRMTVQKRIVVRIQASASVNVSSDRVWHPIPPARVMEPLSQLSSRVMVIDGSLPYGRRLRKPMAVLIERDEYEVLVSESVFHMHAGGDTEADAIDAFRGIISGYVDVLSDREATLGPALTAQLAYLRDFVEPA